MEMVHSGVKRISRLDLIRGRFKGEVKTPRPPWARAESFFLESCNKCGDCLPACPSSIVRISDDGFPTIDFSRGECTFCGDCVEACEPGALLKKEDTAPWVPTAHITSACLSYSGVTCRVCGEHCDARALEFQLIVGGPARPSITLQNCTGCGACVKPCPVAAIQIIPEAPKEINA